MPSPTCAEVQTDSATGHRCPLGPTSARLHFTLALGLLLFGLLACALGPAHAQDPTAVTVCSYNLKNWLTQRPFTGEASLEDGVTKSEKAKQHVVDVLKTIQPDILGVCEIGTPEDLADLQTRLKAAGIDLPHTELTHGGDLTRSLALLSRFPISKRESQTQLEYRLGAETLLMQRGILDVTIAITADFQPRFLGVHLKSKRPTAEADEALMRRNEAHLLRRYLDTIFSKDPNSSVLCYGDFNEHRNEPAISEIIGSRASHAHMSDLPLRDTHGLVWTQFWDDADVYSRFDYFFTSRALRPHIDLKASHVFTTPDFAQASDHRPIVLTLHPTPTKSRATAKAAPLNNTATEVRIKASADH